MILILFVVILIKMDDLVYIDTIIFLFIRFGRCNNVINDIGRAAVTLRGEKKQTAVRWDQSYFKSLIVLVLNLISEV